jgi:hypothetical protein
MFQSSAVRIQVLPRPRRVTAFLSIVLRYDTSRKTGIEMAEKDEKGQKKAGRGKPIICGIGSPVG